MKHRDVTIDIDAPREPIASLEGHRRQEVRLAIAQLIMLMIGAVVVVGVLFTLIVLTWKM